MFVNKLGLKNNIVNFRAKNSQENSSAQKNISENKAVCSPAAADAIRAKNLPSAKNYAYLQDINIPALNLNGKLYMLPNGQKCLVANKEGPTVLKTFFKVGSMNEPDNLRGISHFIEHSLFNGSKTLKPTEFVTKVNRMGGNYNASTGFSATDYFIKSPLHKKDDLEKFIQMHADMLVNPTFSQEMIEKERGPVISEIQMLEDNPYNLAQNTAIRNLLSIKSDSADLIGGSVKNIKNLTGDDVKNYYKSNYNPKDALTVVIGEIDEKKTMELLSKYFADFKNTESKQSHENLKPITSPVRKDLTSPNTQSTIIQLAFTGPKNKENKTATAALITALTGYKNAKLSDALRDTTKEVFGNYETVSNQEDAPVAIMFSASTSKNNEEKILKTMYEKLHEMAHVPLTEKELEIVKNKMKLILDVKAESNDAIAATLGTNFVSRGDFEAIINTKKSIDALTSQDITATAKKFLDLNKVSIAVVKPDKNKSISFNGKIHNDIKMYKTPNNAEIITQNIPSAKLNALNFKFIFDKKPQKASIPDILSTMLLMGTSQVDEKTFFNIEDENNIVSSVNATWAGINYNYSFQQDKMPMVLDNFNRRLTFPPLTRENFEKAKNEIRNAYYSAPKSAAHRAIETLYEGTPISSTPRKTVEELENITFEDVVKFYNDALKSAKLTVTLSGNLSDNKDLNILYANLAQNGVVYNPNDVKYDGGAKSLSQNKIVTEAQDRNQADIIQLFRLKESGNIIDNASLLLMNEILGGNSNSRLFNDLREKQKLAYRVNSTINHDPVSNEGFLALKISTTTDGTNNPKQSENLKKSIDGFNNHINKMISQKVSGEELDAARLQIKSRLKFASESTDGKNALLSTSMMTPYKMFYQQEFLKALDMVTPDDIQRVASYYLTKPYVISVIASDKTLKENEEYLKGFGNYKKY